MATPNKRKAFVCVGLAVSSVLVAASVQAQGVSFEAARFFGVGSKPHSVAVGDFNGDGLPDLAVANSAPADGRYYVSVLINNTPRTPR